MNFLFLTAVFHNFQEDSDRSDEERQRKHGDEHSEDDVLSVITERRVNPILVDEKDYPHDVDNLIEEYVKVVDMTFIWPIGKYCEEVEEVVTCETSETILEAS